MSDNSRIAWCDATWNPIVGCSPVSAACDHCYAARMGKRLAGRCGYPREFSQVTFREDSLDQPLRWRKPRRIFVCSMGDLFHEEARNEDRMRIWNVMCKAHWHTFLVLTKRAEEMYEWCRVYGCPENVWTGVTAENQETLDDRLVHLLRVASKVRFLSCEPMLGKIDIGTSIALAYRGCKTDGMERDIEWVIAGGESGPGARPTHPEWVRSLRDQCAAGGVPFFFKQWGEWAYVEPSGAPDDGGDVVRVGKRAAGRLLDGREHLEFPKVKP
jgi:protein gp37